MRNACFEAIRDFARRTSSTPWQLERIDVAFSLLDMIERPDAIQQDGYGHCGPVAFLRNWGYRDPLAATMAAIHLYEQGWCDVGTYRVAPCPELLAKDFAAIRDKAGKPVSITPAVWMMAGALRDAENAGIDFEGDPEESIAEITSGAEVAEWLQATGRFSSITDETNVWFTKGIAHALALRPDVYTDVILQVNTNMIAPGTHAGPLAYVPTHIMALRSPIVDRGATLHVEYWTWGGYDAKDIPRDEFDRNYYGAVTAAASAPRPPALSASLRTPAMPSSVRAAIVAPGSVEVRWTTTSADQDEWYEVLRSVGSGASVRVGSSGRGTASVISRSPTPPRRTLRLHATGTA